RNRPDVPPSFPTLRSADLDPDYSKVLRNDEFGYWTITVERPLLDESGQPVLDRKGKPKPDPKKRDTENVPFTYVGSTAGAAGKEDRKSTRLNSCHEWISYA